MPEMSVFDQFEWLLISEWAAKLGWLLVILGHPATGVVGNATVMFPQLALANDKIRRQHRFTKSSTLDPQ
jgi:hypothetical protein